MTWAKPGDDIRSHLNARTVNKLLNKPVRKGSEQFLATPVSEHIILNAWAATGVTIDQFDPVKITGPVLEGNTGYRDVKVDVPTDPPLYVDWGVAQGTIKEKYSSQIILKGMTWANVEIIDEEHKYVDFFDGGLKTTDNGPAKLILPGELDEEDEQQPSFIWLKGVTPDCCCLGTITSIDETDPLNIFAEVEVELAPADRPDLIERTVKVYDRACILDEEPENLENIKIWFSWYMHPTLNKGTFFANNRCCT
jgi:hypothetical protein